jgi:hypothetical protein
MNASLNELSDVARKLNEKSNNLNRLISSTNERLQELNFGTEVWLVNDPIEASDVETVDREREVPVEPFCDANLLGYCELEDEWQLAVKETVLVRKTNALGSTWWQARDTTRFVPLLKATRAIRMKAMRLVPKLLDELKSEAEQLLKSIEKAEEQAKKL